MRRNQSKTGNTIVLINVRDRLLDTLTSDYLEQKKDHAKESNAYFFLRALRPSIKLVVADGHYNLNYKFSHL